jgi:hypothetical protein
MPPHGVHLTPFHALIDHNLFLSSHSDAILKRRTPLLPQTDHPDAIEKRLWSAADNLRANSNYASNEYFLPVMGLIFLRHAYNRYLAVRDDIQDRLPKRGGKTRALTKEDFSQNPLPKWYRSRRS